MSKTLKNLKNEVCCEKEEMIVNQWTITAR